MLGHSLLELTLRAAAYIPQLGELREPAKLQDGYYISSRCPNG